MKSLGLTERTVPRAGIDMRENSEVRRVKRLGGLERGEGGMSPTVYTAAYSGTGKSGDAYDAEVAPAIKRQVNPRLCLSRYST